MHAKLDIYIFTVSWNFHLVEFEMKWKKPTLIDSNLQNITQIDYSF